MKIALSVNNCPSVVAELNSEGYLGAHLNLRRDESGLETGSIKISGFDISNKESTKFLKGPSLDVKVGDKITLNINPKLEATPLKVIAKSAENLAYENLPLEQAEQIIKSSEDQITELKNILKKMRTVLNEVDFKTFALSIGHTMSTYHEKIQAPIYRCHPVLLPKELKNHSL